MYCLHLFYHLNVTKLRFEQDNVNQNQEKTNCYSQPKCTLSLPNAIARQHFKEKSIHFST